MAGCEKCFFGECVKVGPKGRDDSPFVIVAESPGPQEVFKKEAFLGQPSQLLLDILKQTWGDAWPTCEPYYLQAIECMPKKKDPKTLAKATQACSKRLHEAISKHPRKVILALGNAAIWSLTGDYNIKITKTRGTVYKSSLAAEGIISTVHPSYLLRGAGSIQQFKKDIRTAHTLLTGTETKADLTQEITTAGQFKFRGYHVIKNEAEYQKLVAKLKTVPEAAADFETDGFDPRAIYVNEPAFKGEGILCLIISYRPDYAYVIPGTLLDDTIFQNDCKFTWQNGKFDYNWGKMYNMPSIRINGDTMLASYALNEMGGIHDLEQLGADWLNAPNYKAMLDKHLPSKKHSYAYIPKDVLYEYGAIDGALTYHLSKVLIPRVLADPYLKRVYLEILLPAAEFLAQVEANGFYVDMHRVEENQKVIGGEAAKIDAELQELVEPLVGPGINIRSPKQVHNLLYNVLKLGPTSYATDADTLEKLPKHPFVEGLKKYRKLNKLVSTYVTALPKKLGTDGRMHTTFKLHGTTTGRLSSSKPNMQNQPRDARIRGQFVAPAGRALLEVDLSQAELRMLAQMSKCAVMLELFRAGRSIHGEVATYIFGDGWGKEQKMIAKNVNFGIVYGISPYGLMEQINVGAARLGSDLRVTFSEAKEWLDAWADLYPGAWTYIQQCREAPIRGDTILSAFGRKRRFNVVTRDKLREMQNEAANFPHQSGAHDITLLAGIHTEKELRTKYDCLIVNEVHDCLVCDLPDKMSIIKPVAQKIVETMLQIPKDWGMHDVPFEAEAEVGYRWGSLVEFNPYDTNIEPEMTAFDVVGTPPVYK